MFKEARSPAIEQRPLTRAYDGEIQGAIVEARSTLESSPIGKIPEIIKAARKILIKRHPVLRRVLTDDNLLRRIRELNRGKSSQADPTFIWIDRRNPSFSTADKESIPLDVLTPTESIEIVTLPAPQAPPAPPAPPPQPPPPPPPTPIPLPVAPPAPPAPPPPAPPVPEQTNDEKKKMITLGKVMIDLTNAINGLAANQAETVDVSQFIFDGLGRLSDTLDTQTGIFLDMMDRFNEVNKNQERILELLLNQGKGSAPVLTTLGEPVHERQPHMPPLRGNVVEVLRADLCFGAAWQRLSVGRPLTNNEENWVSLVPYLVGKLRRKHRMKPEQPFGVIVFGWNPSIRVSQEIFLRLGVEKIFWITTHDTGDQAKRLADKINPSNGQAAIIVNKVSGSHAVQGAIDMCKAYGMAYYRTERLEINTSAAAYKFLDWFNQEWYELRENQRIHATAEVSEKHVHNGIAT